MKIDLKKFGTTLTSRQAGKESFLALQPMLSTIGSKEALVVNFDGVITFSPSWGDEFLTPLQKRFDKHLTLEKTNNPSVQATLKLLEQIQKVKFKQNL